jgi:hypothetical protein
MSTTTARSSTASPAPDVDEELAQADRRRDREVARDPGRDHQRMAALAAIGGNGERRSRWRERVDQF